MIFRFTLIERLLLNRDIIPHPLTDAAAYPGLSHALRTAVRLGLTEALNAEAQSTAQLARQAGISEKGTELLLNCLEALGYVTSAPNGYRLNKRGLKFLPKHSPDSMHYFILFSDMIEETFGTLENSLKAGRQDLYNLDVYTERQWELFTRAMIDLARTNLAEVTQKINLPDNTANLIDLGGSHGLYSIELCKKYNRLSAVIADYEEVRRYTDECVAAANMQDRVRFLELDFSKQPIPTGFQAALSFNIIHGFDDAKNRAFFQNVYQCLDAGGKFYILDQIQGLGANTQLSKATVAYMALNLFHQAGGNTYSFDTIRQWAGDTGFTKWKLLKLNAPGFGLVELVK